MNQPRPLPPVPHRSERWFKENGSHLLNEAEPEKRAACFGGVSRAISGKAKSARVNGCLVGHGTLEALEADSDDLGLSAAGQEILRERLAAWGR